MVDKLNVLNLATTTEGGAGIATLKINEILNLFGYNSIILSKNDLNKAPKIIDKIEKRLKNYFTKNSFKKKYCFENKFENKEYVTANKILAKTPFKPDIIFLHWVSNFINSKTVYELEQETGAKILWLMMDNAPLTGGCHYPWKCEGYQKSCLNCPAINKNSKKYIASKNLLHKKKYLPNNIKIIAASEIDYQRAILSSVFKRENIYKILFPIDHEKFKPALKSEAKHYFNIDYNKKVILYGSVSLDNMRKGGRFFFEAVKHLQNILLENEVCLDKYVIMLAGNRAKNYHDLLNEIKIPFVELGHLTENELIKSYQAADVFVSTSLEDSGPLMVNQSIMCGTPVVAFDTGVSKDIIIPKKTGFIVDKKNSLNLSKSIFKVLNQDDKLYDEMALNCRDLALDKLHHKSFIQSLEAILL